MERINLKEFIDKTNLLKKPELQLEELGNPINFNWNKCKLETVSFGHGITTTPLQATAVYASIANGGRLIKPSLIENKNFKSHEILVSKKLVKNINKILRKVVTEENGTASLADIDGYYVAGKTGTSQNYQNKDQNLNTFISNFSFTKTKIRFTGNVGEPPSCKRINL